LKCLIDGAMYANTGMYVIFDEKTAVRVEAKDLGLTFAIETLCVWIVVMVVCMKESYTATRLILSE
jgi:hypothetical protein